jgi:S-formylglutathione hydrolase
MFDYVAKELVAIASSDELPIDANKLSICGHSVGGHGALVIGLKHSRIFKTISAFAPVCEPSKCAWGEKAFTGFLGDNRADWREYDACAILADYNGERVDILVDVGSGDQFEKDGQLRTAALRAVSLRPKNASIVLRVQHEYDHGYYFVSTFIESHLKFHNERLRKFDDINSAVMAAHE